MDVLSADLSNITDHTRSTSDIVVPQIDVSQIAVPQGDIVIPNEDGQGEALAGAIVGNLDNAASGVAQIARNLDAGPITAVVLGVAAGISVAASDEGNMGDGLEVFTETALPFGEMFTELAEGDERGAIVATLSEIADMAGSFIGTKIGILTGGAVTGAASSMIVGADASPQMLLLGSAIGAGAGAVAAGFGLSKAITRLVEKSPQLVDGISHGIKHTLDRVGIDTAVLKSRYDVATQNMATKRDQAMDYIDRQWQGLTKCFNRIVSGDVPVMVKNESSAPDTGSHPVSNPQILKP